MLRLEVRKEGRGILKHAVGKITAAARSVKIKPAVRNTEKYNHGL
jgi:hypothetical protein